MSKVEVGAPTWGSLKWINFDIYDVGLKCFNCITFTSSFEEQQQQQQQKLSAASKCCKFQVRASSLS